MTESIVLEAPAKTNLFLRILSREENGYHGLETLFCKLDLSDELRITRREEPGIRLTVEGGDTGPSESNLAVRAAKAVLTATGNRFGVDIHLVKRIPVQAGLGGGSSDAAAALLGVNQLAGNAVPRAELLHLGQKLGADVPFFLSGGDLALGWGYGGRLLVLPPLPRQAALILMPQAAVSTADAYRWLDEARVGWAGRGSVALNLSALAAWGDIARLAGNDFESVIMGREPRIRAGFEAMVKTRPLLCRMSGSGAALVAIYRSSADRDNARLELGNRWGKVWEVHTGGQFC